MRRALAAYIPWLLAGIGLRWHRTTAPGTWDGRITTPAAWDGRAR